MKSKNDGNKTIEFILRSLLIIEFWRGGLSQDTIAQRLGISKTDVSAVLKGVRRQVATDEEVER